jgi:hypothetical protein
MVYQRIVPAPHIFVMAALLGIAAAVAVILVVRRWGVERIRLITLVPLCGLMVFLLGFNGHLLDLNYSARPLAEQIAKAAPDTRSVAELDVRRDLVYGVAFYRDHEVRNYATEGVPAGEHILIIPTRETPLLQQYLAGRVYQQIFLYPTQGLSVFRVYPMNPDELNAHPPSNTADTPPVTPARNPGLTTGS